MKLKLKIAKSIEMMVNNKMISELTFNHRKIIKSIFPKIKNNDLIECCCKNGGKVDLIFKVNNEIYNISILNDRFNIRIRINDFIRFLKSIGISNESVLSLLEYHYAYDTMGFYGEDLYSFFEEEIRCVDEEFKNKEKLYRLIEYLFVKENSGKEVHYFYYGDCRSGVIISRESFVKVLLEYKDNYTHKYMKVGLFNFQPISRILQNDMLKNICILKLNLKPIIKKITA